ncbi:MAG: hypothetical protein ACJ758_05765 [Actinomycetota bacterium]
MSSGTVVPRGGRLQLLAVLAALVSIVALVGRDATTDHAIRAQLRSQVRSSANVVPASTPASAPPPASNIGMFSGLGTWVDIYETSSWHHPKRTVKAMHAHGVRTLYLQTSNYTHKPAIVYRQATMRFLNYAHKDGMRVVAWYLPGLKQPDFEFQRIMAAINLRTKSGESFDGFALDIESPAVQPPSERTRRLIALSARVRAEVGSNYRLGAIIPSPRGMQKHPGYWPDFPYTQTASLYNAFLPMTYFTWRVSGESAAKKYSTMCINIIRRETSNASEPIHIIGGISNQATIPETKGFVSAVKEEHAWGASYYAFAGTSGGEWRVLRNVPAPDRG